MDTTSLKHGNSSLFLSALFFVLGFVALGHTVTGNLWFGMSLAKSEPAQYWQGGSAVFIDVMVAALAGACGWLFSRKRWVASGFVAILAVVFALMSALSLVGLGAMERVAKAKGIEVANASAKESASDRNVFLAGAHERNLSWLRQQASNPALSRTERREIRAELAEATKAGPDLLQPRIDTPMADPQAEFIAEISGLPVDKIQVFFVAALAILLIIGKTVSFWLAGYFSRVKTISTQTLSIDNPSQATALSNSPININTLQNEREALPPVDNPDPVKQFPAPVEDCEASSENPPHSSTLTRLNPPLPSTDDQESEVRRLGAALRQTVSRHVFDETILAQFLAEQTRVRPGFRVSAQNLYAAYLNYVQKNNYSVLSQNQFGRLCSAAGLQRISNRRGMDYLDLVLLDEAEAGEVSQAAAA